MYLYRADICAHLKKCILQEFCGTSIFFYLVHPQLLADPFIIYWPSFYLTRAGDIDGISK